MQDGSSDIAGTLFQLASSFVDIVDHFLRCAGSWQPSVRPRNTHLEPIRRTVEESYVLGSGDSASDSVYKFSCACLIGIFKRQKFLFKVVDVDVLCCYKLNWICLQFLFAVTFMRVSQAEQRRLFGEALVDELCYINGLLGGPLFRKSWVCSELFLF